MRLTAKFVACLLMAIVIILVLDGVTRARRTLSRFDRDMLRNARTRGRAIMPLVRDAWETHGQAYALDLIQEADQENEDVRIRWVWLDAAAGDPHGPEASRERVAALVGRDLVCFKEEAGHGEGYLYTYAPIEVDRPRRGALEFRESLAPMHKFLHETIARGFLLVGTMAVVSAVVVSLLGVVFLGRPLKKLAGKARRMGAGDLSGPANLRGRDELAELGRALDEMCEKLAGAQDRVRAETAARIGALEQLRHADRLATVGRLASGVAHELGTPLNVVMGRAGMIARGSLPPAEAAACAEIIRTQAERMAAIIRQLLGFARPRKPQKTLADLRDIARQTLELMEPLARKKDVRLYLAGEDVPASTDMDVAQIQQVLMNLTDNALSAVGNQGTVEIGFRTEIAKPPEGITGAEGEYLCLYIRDNGEGIAAENLPHIFEPFFTTKDVGEGTGLGLSISHSIVHEHGGWIQVESKPGEGSCFSVYLPKGA